MRYLLILLLPILLFAQQEFEPKYGIIEKDTLTASSATALDTSMEVYIGHWQGAVTLAVSPDSISGTPTTITITAAIRFQNFNYGEAQSVGTISAADINSGEDQYFGLSDLSWWTWADYVIIYFSSASGTYSVALEYQIKGQ